MAFEINLMALNSSGFGLPPRLFGYGITPDSIATVILDDYFLEYADKLKVGDWIMVTSSDVSPLPGALLIVQTILLDSDGIPTSITVSQHS
jgi:hypothetical protein